MNGTYPTLIKTPIKEIVFDLQFGEVLSNDFFVGFNLEDSRLAEVFDSCVPLMGSKFSLTSSETKRVNEQLGLVFKSSSEILFLRRESFTYHYIKEYIPFERLQNRFFELLTLAKNIIKIKINVSNLSVRYVNEINIDPVELASNLIFTYPKQSSDRVINNYQYVTEFAYKEEEEFLIRILSSKIEDSKLLLDITVKKEVRGELSSIRESLQDNISKMRHLKNRAFFDSVTVQTLIKYL